MPQINVKSETSLGTINVSIPEGTQTTGPLEWDGAINLPQLLSPNDIMLDSLNNADVNAAIEIGFPDTTRIFSQPVKIIIPGQAGKLAGWILNGKFTPITCLMKTDSANDLEKNNEGYLNVGDDLIIWTNHFTTFVTYTEHINTTKSKVPLLSDVSVSYWCYDAISSLIGKGIVFGYPDGTFKPDAYITRAEFVAMLAKAVSLNTCETTGTFMDLSVNDWCYGAVNAANSARLVSGTGNNMFEPNTLITREQIAIIVTNALGDKTPIDSTQLDIFSDKSTISKWAISGMTHAVKAGIISGMTTYTLAPKANATRAQAAMMIYKMLLALGK
ncbi:MAG: S-layer homology domain-containing protein [Syntrophomonadaceae bacterium]|nr:S-layer homology domain-containing protein [Syntrophomonadaceae bacterium]